MIYVRFEQCYVRCCMTAEVANFANYGEIPDNLVCQHLSERIAGYLKTNDVYHTSDYIYAKGATSEEAWKNAISKINDLTQDYSYNGQQVRYFWFVDYNDGTGWEHEELRTIIKEMPGVVKLGKYTNANTANKLIGYMVPFENKNGDCSDDD